MMLASMCVKLGVELLFINGSPCMYTLQYHIIDEICIILSSMAFILFIIMMIFHVFF